MCLPRPPAQARPGDLPLGSICYGTSHKKKAMEGENLDLQPGHVTLSELLNVTESLLQHPQNRDNDPVLGSSCED